VLLAWPLLLAVLYPLTGQQRLPWTGVGDGRYLEWLLPLAALVHASRLIRDEVEGGTIVYLLGRPIGRTSILAGELAAYLAAVLAVSWSSLALGYVLAPPAPPLAGEATLLRALAASGAALAAYGALFTFLGLVLRKPLVAGLLIVMGQWVVGLTGLLPRLPLTSYLLAIAGVPSAPPEVTTEVAIAVAAVFTAAFLVASVIAFRSGEYVPEP
jgi:ABC-2 type transport system permease protein